MDGSTVDYSRSEWGSLPIQDRIRAMKNTLDDEPEGDIAESLGQPTKPFFPPTHQHKDSLTSEETEELSEVSDPPRRSSVVDMWRKRESSTTSGSGAPKEISAAVSSRNFQNMSPVSPFGNSERQVVVGIPGRQEKDSSYDFEEKKEPTPEEELSRVQQLQRQNPPSPSFGFKASTSPFHSRSQPELGARKSQEEEVATSGDTWKKRSSGTNLPPLPNASGVLDGWNKRGQDNHSSPKPSYLVDMESPRQSPIAHEESRDFKSDSTAGGDEARRNDEPPSIADKGSPGFGDVRAKWAQFGAGKVQTREGLQRRPSQTGSSPRVSVGSSPTVSVGKKWGQNSKDIIGVQDPTGDHFGETNRQTGLRRQSEKVENAKRGSPPQQKSGVNVSKDHTNETSTPNTLLRREEMLKRNRRAGIEHNKRFESETSSKMIETQKGGLSLQTSEDGPSAGSVDMNETPTRKKDHLKKLGQMHVSRPKPANEMVSRPDRSPMMPENQTHRLPVNGTSDSNARQQTKGEELEQPGHIAPRTPAARPGKNIVADKKQKLVQHRRRTKTTSTPERQRDDDSITSDVLSQAFSDAIPDDERKQLSKDLTAYKQRTSRSEDTMTRPSIPMQTLMACGVDEDDVFGDSFCAGKPKRSPEPAQAEYSSLCASDSNVSDAVRSNIARQSKNQYTQQASHSDVLSDAGQSDAESFLSIDGTLNSGISSQISAASPRSTTASSLANRAGRRLREKRQRKSAQINQSPNLNTGVPSIMDDQRLVNPTQPSQYHPTKPSMTSSISPMKEALTTDVLTQDAIDPTPTVMLGAPQRVSDPPTQSDVSTTTPATTLKEFPHRAPSFSSDTSATNSQMVCTITSETTGGRGSRNGKKSSPRTPRGSSFAAKDIVAEEFVSESNANVEAFKSAYQSLSLEQIAHDLQEEVAGSVFDVQALDLKKFAQDLNQGMTAASESLNRLVGTGIFAQGNRRISSKRDTSPMEEEVAIEVEYIEDSDGEEIEEGEI